ncbi:MAG: hypothetical protein KQ78_01440 [Candidatus Izimaplasma bacterium HR2]|nr:MAG: hypothetical protein KQ78_01440 [Candidatus Izimaplasma bacterium HR2]
MIKIYEFIKYFHTNLIKLVIVILLIFALYMNNNANVSARRFVEDYNNEINVESNIDDDELFNEDYTKEKINTNSFIIVLGNIMVQNYIQENQLYCYCNYRFVQLNLISNEDCYTILMNAD